MRGNVGEVEARRGSAYLEVLWAGAPSAALDVLRERGVRVVHVPAERCVDQVESRAPDLVVLGEAAASRAASIAGELRERSNGATVPVIVLSAAASPFQARDRRAGIVAQLAPSLGASVVAERIEEILLDVASIPSLRPVVTSWREMDEWLEAAVRSGSSGLLVTSNPVGALAIGANGRLAPTPDALRRGLRRPKTDEPVTMKFVELPPDRLVVLRPGPTTGEPPRLEGARALVVHPDRARADAWRAAFDAAGGDAVAVRADADTLAQASAFAPALVVIASAALSDGSVAALWEDARFAALSWLVVDETELLPIEPSRIVAQAGALSAVERALRRRLERGGLIVGRIERFGPAGWLKQVASCGQPVTLVLRSVLGRAELSLAGGRIRGARFAPADDGARSVDGRDALAVLRSMPFGRVISGPRELVYATESTLLEGEIIETLQRPRLPGAGDATSRTDPAGADDVPRPPIAACR